MALPPGSPPSSLRFSKEKSEENEEGPGAHEMCIRGASITNFKLAMLTQQYILHTRRVQVGLAPRPYHSKSGKPLYNSQRLSCSATKLSYTARLSNARFAKMFLAKTVLILMDERKAKPMRKYFKRVTGLWYTPKSSAPPLYVARYIAGLSCRCPFKVRSAWGVTYRKFCRFVTHEARTLYNSGCGFGWLYQPKGIFTSLLNNSGGHKRLQVEVNLYRELVELYSIKSPFSRWLIENRSAWLNQAVNPKINLLTARQDNLGSRAQALPVTHKDRSVRIRHPQLRRD